MTAKNGAAAVANADKFTSYAVGYCLKWVRAEAWQIGGLYGSAIDAWHGATKRHPGDRNPPEGAPCFYSGGQYGHIVIARKGTNPPMRSTDCTYSGHVDNAAMSWPETAWGDDYLGWTEDLNGVTLPLTTTPPKDEDMADYFHGKATKKVTLKDGAWTAISWDASNNTKWFDGYGILVGGRKFSAVLSVKVTGRGGAVVDTSWVEIEGGDPAETYPTSVLGAWDSVTDARNGFCQDGRRLRARVRVRGGDATLERADVNVLAFT